MAAISRKTSGDPQQSFCQALKIKFQETEWVGSGLEIAAENSYDSCTVAGTKEHMLTFEKKYPDAIRLDVPAAYHSKHMDKIVGPIQKQLGNILGAQIACSKIFSTVTGDEISPKQLAEPSHWANGVRNIVRFREAISHCIQKTVDSATHDSCIVIEISPKCQLKQYIKQEAQRLRVFPKILQSSSVGKDAEEFTHSACKLWEMGLPVKFGTSSAPQAQQGRQLPLRRFDRDLNVWIPPPKNKAFREQGPLGVQHYQGEAVLVERGSSMSGAPGNLPNQTKIEFTPLPDDFILATLQATSDDIPQIYDHWWRKELVAPGAFLSMVALDAVTAVETAHGNIGLLASLGIRFHQPVFLHSRTRMQPDVLQVQIGPRSDFGMFSQKKMCADGKVQYIETTVVFDMEDALGHHNTHALAAVDVREVYEVLEHCNLMFGPSLKCVTDCFWDPHRQEGKAMLHVDCSADLKSLGARAALLDQWFQTALGLSLRHLHRQSGRPCTAIPVSIESLKVLNKDKYNCDMVAFVQWNGESHGTFRVTGVIATRQGDVVLEIRNACARILDSNVPDLAAENHFWRLVQTPLPKTHLESQDKKISAIVFEDKLGIARKLATESLCLATDSIWIPDLGSKENDVFGRLILQLQTRKISEFDVILYMSTGMADGTGANLEEIHGSGLPAANDNIDAYYQDVLREQLHFRELIRIVMSEEQPWPFIYGITCGTSSLSSKSANRPSGAALWGMGKCLTVEEILSPSPSIGSKIRMVELESAALENIQVLACELRRPRNDSSETIIRAGEAFRLELDAEPWSWSETQVRLQEPSGKDGDLMPTYLGLYREGLATKINREDQIMRTEEEALVSVNAIVATPKEHYNMHGLGITMSPLESDRSSKMNPLRMLDFDGLLDSGRLVSCCYPSTARFGQVVVPSSCVLPRELLCSAWPIVSYHLVVKQFLELTEKKQDSLSCCTSFPLRVDVVPGVHQKLYLEVLCHVANRWRREVHVCSDSKINGMLVPLQHAVDHQQLSRLEAGGLVVQLGQACNLAISHVQGISAHCIHEPALLDQLYLPNLVLQLHELLKSKACDQEHEVTQHQANVYDFEVLGKFLPTKLSVPLLVRQQQVHQLRERQELYETDAAYLVVGALRLQGLGFVIAEELVHKGARHIILTGRSLPVGEELAGLNAAVQNMKQNGCSVDFVKADVNKLDGAGSLHQALVSSLPKIRGIIHGAAAWDDKMFKDVTPATFNKVLQPKVLGTLALHCLANNLNLHHFVLQSSVVHVLGNYGQVPYASGNAFQDAFASYRRSHGLPGIAINWTSLDEVGVLANKRDMVKHIEKTRGFKAISRSTIRIAWEVALMLNRPSLTVAAFNFEQVHQMAVAQNPLVRGRLHYLIKQNERRGDLTGRTLALDSMTKTCPSKKCDLHSFIPQVLADLLDLKELELGESLHNQGLDSSLAIEAQSRLMQRNVDVGLVELQDTTRPVRSLIEQLLKD